MRCIAGNGGNGCISHARENYGFKIADGGNGGKGGDVYFQASERLSNLYELRRAHFKGNNGKSGKGQKRNGPIGRDINYTVPVGTEIFITDKPNIHKLPAEKAAKMTKPNQKENK